MERKRFSVLFFIKRSKLLKNGEAPDQRKNLRDFHFMHII